MKSKRRAGRDDPCSLNLASVFNLSLLLIWRQKVCAWKVRQSNGREERNTLFRFKGNADLFIKVLIVTQAFRREARRVVVERNVAGGNSVMAKAFLNSLDCHVGGASSQRRSEPVIGRAAQL